ncbi:MAG: hypothetical protein MI739_04810, partial [Bacteroidales bacterium]|nr:hypothetical protein [Bacteroidales bacterium]
MIPPLFGAIPTSSNFHRRDSEWFRSCRNPIEETQNGFDLVEIPSKRLRMISVLSKSHRRDSEWFRSCRNLIEETQNDFGLVEISSKRLRMVSI